MPVNTNVRQLTEAGSQLIREIETHLEVYVIDKCKGIEGTEEWPDQKSDFREIAYNWVFASPQESNFWRYYKEEE